jgi:hypothetical protein
VPHDQGGQIKAIDSGLVVDSFGGSPRETVDQSFTTTRPNAPDGRELHLGLPRRRDPHGNPPISGG